MPGPVVGPGRGGGGGGSGLVPAGCVGPGLRAEREAVGSGQIEVPGCSPRGGMDGGSRKLPSLVQHQDGSWCCQSRACGGVPLGERTDLV